MQDIRQSKSTYASGAIVFGDQIDKGHNAVCTFHVAINNFNSVAETTECSNRTIQCLVVVEELFLGYSVVGETSTMSIRVVIIEGAGLAIVSILVCSK